MKILIVDDNAAIREIIRDILVDEGHNVRIASTVEEAVAKIGDFGPAAVYLDSKVGDEDGLHMISEIADDVPPERMHVILLKGATDLAPTDNPYIVASIDKPFKSSDIIGALKLVQEEEREASAEKKVRKRGILHRRPKKDRIPAPTEELLRSHDVSFGSSYVVFEQFPERIYEFIGLFDPGQYDVMVVTTDKAKAIKERFTYSSMEVLPLSSNRKAGSLGIQELGTITSRVRSFVESHGKPVVVFDTFGDIVAADGLNQSLLMLQQLMAGKSRMCTFGVSVDDSSLTDKDRNIFLHSMIEYDKE